MTRKKEQSDKKKKGMTDWSDRERPETICLFDVDGTLTPARKPVSSEMIDLLEALKKKTVVGFVGGSDLSKQKQQLGENCLDFFDFGFAENGVVAFRKGQALPTETFISYVGEEKYKEFVNFILRYVADLNIPVKRGNFVEFRTSMINVSPIGRNCSYDERLAFEQYDKAHGIRTRFIQDLKKNFPDLGLTYSIGGQISFDVFPVGFDKTFCLRHLRGEGFKRILFFGDKTDEGGNDHEIYIHKDVEGHSVVSPDHTMKLLREFFSI